MGIQRFRVIGVGLALVIGTTAAAAQANLPADTTVAGRIWASIQTSNPDLAAGRSRLDAARSRTRSLGFGPPVALSAQAEDAPGFDLARGTIVVQLERDLFLRSRGRAARNVGAAEADLAQVALEAAERRLLGQTMRGLGALYGWTQVADRLRAEDSLLGAAEVALRDRFAVGEARYVDVLRVRAERLRAQTDLAAAVAEARMAHERLNALVGGPAGPAAAVFAALVDSSLAGPPPFQVAVELPAPSVDSLIALSGRIRTAQALVAHARASGLVISAEQRPRVAVGAGAQMFTDAGSRRIGPALALSVGLPFTAHRGNKARLLAAERAVAAAEAEAQAILLAVRADLVTASARYESSRDRLRIFDRLLLVGASEEREAALAAYRNGELALIELLDFERALARAETEQWRARIAAVDALADLLSAGSSGAESTSVLAPIETREP
jgi:outer membrane protein, heavy metal efflux system